MVAPETLARSDRLIRSALPGAEVCRLDALQSGASSITLRALVRTGASESLMVVKTVADGLPATGHRDLARQVRVLDHLRVHSSIPVPEVLAFDAGDPPVRAPMYVMAFVAGETFDPTNQASTEDTRPLPRVVTARAHEAVQTLAALQAVEVAPLGEAPVGLVAELAHWEHALATTRGPHSEPSEYVLERLRAALPAAHAPVLVHGDYRLGNILFRGSDAAAVLDWEIWSIADPRLDLGWLLARSYDGHPSRPPAGFGFPDPDALLSACAVDRPADFDWFLGLAALKHAAASALIDKRSSAASGRDPGRVLRLLQWADARISIHEEGHHHV